MYIHSACYHVERLFNFGTRVPKGVLLKHEYSATINEGMVISEYKVCT
jgi:hypothetical protein